MPSFLSLLLAVAVLELKENLNYLQCSCIAETCLEGLMVKNKIEIGFPVWFKKKKKSRKTGSIPLYTELSVRT